MERSGDRLVRAVRHHGVSRSHNSIRAGVLPLSTKARAAMGCNVLGRESEINSLKRGGGLSEGILEWAIEEYIMGTVVRGFPSSGGIPIVWGI